MLSKPMLWIGAIPSGLIGLGSILLGVVLAVLVVTTNLHANLSILYSSQDIPLDGIFSVLAPLLLGVGVVMLGLLIVSRLPINWLAQLGALAQLMLGLLGVYLVLQEMEDIAPDNLLIHAGGGLTSCLLIAGLSSWAGWKPKSVRLQVNRFSLRIALGFGTLSLVVALLLTRWRLEDTPEFGSMIFLAGSFISFIIGMAYVASYPKLENLSNFEGAVMGMLSTTLASLGSAWFVSFTAMVGRYPFHLELATGSVYIMSSFELFLLLVWWPILFATLCTPFGTLGGALAAALTKLLPADSPRHIG